MLPLQSGVGSIANAVLLGLEKSKFENLEMYSEILQDSVFKLIKSGKVAFASGCAFTPSPTVKAMYEEEPELYRKHILLRPLDITNHPEVIRRLGVIAMNTPLEFDIYGQANSTHTLGCTMMNGIGGSGDFMRNGYLTIFSTESTARNGAISRIVPMVTHADHTEHDTMVFITEQGVADIRGLTPLKRAKLIINNCAHPDYREQLLEYLNYSSHNFPGHEPQALEHAFDMQKAFIQSGTMLK
ncbi:Succinyl-CoA:coenzyme A transferase [bioreactor metagenome]|uniref:Succinyl-CoA:coenzyme A transferase n=1 Tax=bioreactor metagenome TaxID=1076179 RepID=A0A645BIC4_9ZZZZ